MCVCVGGRVKSWSGGTWRCRVVVELDGGLQIARLDGGGRERGGD